MRYILPFLFLHAPQSQLILSANQNVWQGGIEHSPRVLKSLKVYFWMGHRQETFEPVKFQECLDSCKGTECHQGLKSGRYVRWGHCLKVGIWEVGWASYFMLVEVTWCCKLTTLADVRVCKIIYSSKISSLSWVGKHRGFMCVISFKGTWRDAKLLFLEGFQLPLHQ